MRSKGIMSIAAAATLCFVALAFAQGQEKFGVKVYPGAQLDAATTDNVKKMISQDAACYRTTDSLAKVNAFYKGQPNLTLMGETPEGSAFSKGAGADMDVMVTVQSPWMDMATGKMMKDTLISIVNQKKE
jgi:hypothetical protein